MTANKRIALNVVATYGRSLYALVIGLFCGRWTLMALGEVDYGLMGVVGGLMGFVAFFNGLMAEAVCRFYSFAAGKSVLEESRRWFSLAVMIHTALPSILIAIGYPTGVWAIEHFLTIPPERVADCLWVWRLTCLSGFCAMVNVPFQAMYTAKQEIAELTIYGFATSTLNACVLGYMVTHPGVWLVRYALWTMLLAFVPQAIICYRAVRKYPECRLCRLTWADRARLIQLLGFVTSRLIAAVSTLLSTQGVSIAVNKILGPTRNAAMSIGNTVIHQTAALSGAMRGAFTPAITTAAGAGDLDGMRRMAQRSSRFSSVSVMVFAIPLLLEVEEVVTLWLKTPPMGAVVIISFMLIDLLLSRISEGHLMCLFALGRIARFQAWESIWFFVRFFIAWGLMVDGLDLLAVGLAYAFTGVGSVGVKIWFGRKYCGLSARAWMREVAGPLMVLFIASVAAGLVPRLLMSASVLRVLATGCAVELVFLPIAWRFCLADSERLTIRNKLHLV